MKSFIEKVRIEIEPIVAELITHFFFISIIFVTTILTNDLLPIKSTEFLNSIKYILIVAALTLITLRLLIVVIIRFFSLGIKNTQNLKKKITNSILDELDKSSFNPSLKEKKVK